MLLEEIISEGTKIKGSFVGVRFSDESSNRIYEFSQSLNIPNLLEKEKYHCTVIYSKGVCLPKNFKPIENLDEPLIIQPKKLHIFKDDDKNVLVIKLDSPELIERHEYLMNKYNLAYDFDEYIPHCTISYDIGNFKIDKNTDLTNLKDLEIVNEYKTQLEKNWSED